MNYRFPMPTEQDWEQYRKEQEHDANLAACEATASVPECIDHLRRTIVEIVLIILNPIYCIVTAAYLAYGAFNAYRWWHDMRSTLLEFIVAIVAGFVLLALSYVIYKLKRLR